jgi:hypothetical protein
LLAVAILARRVFQTWWLHREARLSAWLKQEAEDFEMLVKSPLAIVML